MQETQQADEEKKKRFCSSLKEKKVLHWTAKKITDFMLILETSKDLAAGHSE
ncbi:MAG: hypothetical protein ACLVAT_00155 [Lachnospiraceae bacterium]